MAIIEDLEDLKKLHIDMKSFYSDLIPQMERDEDYYDLDFKDLLNLPKQFKKDAVVLPTAREVVDTATDHITPTHRRITVPRRVANASGTEQARKLKRFYESLLTYLERQPTSSPYRAAVKSLGIYGLGIMKLTFDQRKWPGEPERRQFDSDEEFQEARTEWREARSLLMPFTLRVLNPVEVLFDPFHDPAEWVIETTHKHVSQIKSDYPNWPNANSRGNLEKLDVIEFWDDKERAVMVDGQSALKSKDGTGILHHKWGVHPYIIGDSGLGVDDSEHDPAKRYVGILRYIRGILLAESRSFSIADIVLKAGAWPVRIAEGERANEMPNIKLEYGMIHPMPPGVKVTDLTPQLPPAMVFNFLGLTNSIISSATAPRVTRGLQQPGIKSGFDRQLALGEARLRYGPLSNAVERMLTMLCVKAGILMSNVVKGSVSLVSGTTQDEFVSISGKDFRGHHAVDVKVNIMEPEDEIRKHQDAASMVTAGLMSPQTAIRKYFPDVDPDTELGRILAARLLFSPEVMSLLSKGVTEKIAANIGLEELLSRILDAAQADQRSTQGRRSPSPEGANREEARGAGSRSDQATQREGDLRETGRMQ